jgi:hypothetical protein
MRKVNAVVSSKSRRSCCAIALLANLLACDASVGPRQRKETETATKDASIQPALALCISGGATAVAGEHYGIHLTFSNGVEPQYIIVPLHDEDWEFEVKDARGQPARALSAMSSPSGLPKVRTVWLGRHSSWSVQLMVTFTQADTFEVGVHYPGTVVQEYLDRSSTVPQGTFQLELRSNRLQVEVRPGKNQ